MGGWVGAVVLRAGRTRQRQSRTQSAVPQVHREITLWRWWLLVCEEGVGGYMIGVEACVLTRWMGIGLGRVLWVE